jgi:hypothetical protein
MTFDLQKTVAQLRSRLRDLLKQRAWIDEQLVQVNLALRSVSRMIPDPEEREEVLREINAARRKVAGLTEVISQSLRAMPHQSLSANEVREWIEKEGFDLSDYSQPLATISVTLRRLEERGLVKGTRKRRKVTYQWIGN